MATAPANKAAAEAPSKVTTEDVRSMLHGIVEAARIDLEQRIAKLVPKTSAVATDIVAILAAVSGEPTSVTIQSPGRKAKQQGSYAGQIEYVDGTDWVVDIRYTADAASLVTDRLRDEAGALHAEIDRLNAEAQGHAL